MYRNSTVGVVVPAYNEEGFVGDVLRGIPEFVDRIYVVNDCSLDNTWDEITETSTALSHSSVGVDSTLQLQHSSSEGTGEFVTEPDVPQSVTRTFEQRVAEVRSIGNFVLINHSVNFGAGGAIKTGYLAALMDGVDIVVTIDGDGQMDPTIMDRLIDPVIDGPAEYAKGTRLLNGGHRREMPWIRKFGNTSLTYLTKIASGYWDVTDSQNGYTAITRSALLQIGIEDLFEYYAYCNAILVRLNVHGIQIADVEVPTKYGEEVSDIEISEFILKVTPMLFRNFLWRLRSMFGGRQTLPIALLYVVGGLVLFIGTTLALLVSALARNDRYLRFALVSSVMGGVSVALAMLYERSVSMGAVDVIEVENHPK